MPGRHNELQIQVINKFSAFMRGSGFRKMALGKAHAKSLNFRVRLKEVGDVKGSKSDTDAEEYRVADFKWQEKKFGKVEVEFYADLSNCLTDLDKKYHEAVANLQGNKGETGLIYSYVDEDNFDVAEV